MTLLPSLAEQRRSVGGGRWTSPYSWVPACVSAVPAENAEPVRPIRLSATFRYAVAEMTSILKALLSALRRYLHGCVCGFRSRFVH
jgi:hypothetical protein